MKVRDEVAVPSHYVEELSTATFKHTAAWLASSRVQQQVRPKRRTRGARIHRD